MKKKIVATILAVVLILALACPGVGACGLGLQKQSNANSRAYLAQAEKLVRDCNKSVELLVRAAQLTPYDDVDAMVFATNALIGTTKLAVNALGFDVECTYTEYIVDGQAVMIDPLRVINFIESGGGNNSNNGGSGSSGNGGK